MLINTTDLIGKPLNWAVGKALGGIYEEESVRKAFWRWPTKPPTYSIEAPEYSTDWAIGGPISEMERIDAKWTGEEWIAGKLVAWVPGPTELIAKMRCVVASRLGNSVDIPPEIR